MANSKRILIDARKLGDGGIGVYIENLVDGLLELREAARSGAAPLEAANIELLLLIHPEGLQSNCSGVRETIRGKLQRWEGRVECVPEPCAKYSFSEYFLLARRQRDVLESCDLFHSPHYTLPFNIPIPSVVTIHDVIHVTHPDTLLHKIIGKALIRSAVSRASHVITVSATSAKKLKKITGLSLTPTTVIPNSLRSGTGSATGTKVFEAIKELDLPNNYYLFVGSDRPHKGFRELIGAWAQFAHFLSQQHEQLPKLVVVGERYSEKSKQAVRDAGIADSVVFVGGMNTAQLSLVYQGAKAAVIPSKEEGFGLVALEAMACGVPVVCTPLESLEEVCGECAWYSAGTSSEAICAALLAMASKKSATDKKVDQGMSRAKRFSQQNVARETFGVYGKVLDLPPQEENVEQEPIAMQSNSSRSRPVFGTFRWR